MTHFTDYYLKVIRSCQSIITVEKSAEIEPELFQVQIIKIWRKRRPKTKFKCVKDELSFRFAECRVLTSSWAYSLVWGFEIPEIWCNVWQEEVLGRF